MAKTISGRQAVKVLIKHFAFELVSQKGSHIKLAKHVAGKKITTVIPDHRELARGTLRGALRLAKVSEKDFWKRV